MSTDTPVRVGLIVRVPFEKYVKGDSINDQMVVDQILNSEYVHNVSKIALAAPSPLSNATEEVADDNKALSKNQIKKGK